MVNGAGAPDGDTVDVAAERVSRGRPPASLELGRFDVRPVRVRKSRGPHGARRFALEEPIARVGQPLARHSARGQVGCCRAPRALDPRLCLLKSSWESRGCVLDRRVHRHDLNRRRLRPGLPLQAFPARLKRLLTSHPAIDRRASSACESEEPEPARVSARHAGEANTARRRGSEGHTDAEVRSPVVLSRARVGIGSDVDTQRPDREQVA